VVRESAISAITVWGAVDLATIQWHRSFPYHGGAVSITRLSREWRVNMDGREGDAVSLIEAFEAARRRRASDDDLRFILTVLAFDSSG
jgi:hypothetical protein